MAGNTPDNTADETEETVEERAQEPALERVFAALPPAHGRGFARTWWGVSWQRALEDTALDSTHLRKGRRYARSGAVGAVSVRPGRITAMVRENDGTAHRADVLVPQLDEADWGRLLEVTARTAGHLAALLDGEMPPDLVEDANAVGVQLLPGLGDLRAECDCDEWDHCPHTSAVCYQLARLLDEDPLILLLLLGRDEQRLLTELRELSFVHAMGELPGDTELLADTEESRGEPSPDTVAAAEVYESAATRALPPAPPLVPEPAEVPSWGELPDPAGALDTSALALLAWDTALRARELLAEALAPGHAATPPPAPLDQRQDAVRIAASWPAAAGVPGRLVLAGGFAPEGFEVAVEAWRLGGLAALYALETGPAETECGPAELARAGDRLSSALGADGLTPTLTVEGNRWTVGGSDVQLRYTPGGRWWPYRWDGGRWRPAGAAGRDPAVVLAELG